MSALFDLLVVGGGINGCGIARDAAGRGLSVCVVEKDDLASHTSQWSSKLIHGGLRYLEHYEFRLVAEALAEREVLLRIAPHLIRPLQFVLPHEPHLRPRWMLRAGLFLYDNLSRLGGETMTLPKSFATKLAPAAWGSGLKATFTDGFVYADAKVDDARLVVANAVDARKRGATVLTQTQFVSARRDDGRWQVALELADGTAKHVSARALVNAAGPWVRNLLDAVEGVATRERVKHVRGSHIIVPRVHEKDHAYILQNRDGRIVFVIPYLNRYSLIGTTDVTTTEYEAPRISQEEVTYLLDLANRYLDKPLVESDILAHYAGVRPLYDDGSDNPAQVTRDYVLSLDVGRGDEAPIVSVFGGKITTYRKLALHALEKLQPILAFDATAWTHAAKLPAAPARNVEDLAIVVSATGVLTEADVRHFRDHEFAKAPDDILFRRTKVGLPMTPTELVAARDVIAKALSRT